MNDWMFSGVAAPYQHDPHLQKTSRRRWRIAAASAVAALALSPNWHSVAARDNGQYAGTSPELKSWFDSLRSG